MHRSHFGSRRFSRLVSQLLVPHEHFWLGFDAMNKLQEMMPSKVVALVAGEGGQAEPVSRDLCIRMFKAIDKDGSGDLSRRELLKLLNANGFIPLARILLHTSSHDGSVTQEEFVHMMQDLSAKHPEVKLNERMTEFMGTAGGGKLTTTPSSEAPVRSRKALLVGINYVGQKSQLGGCINDVRNHMQSLARNFGFTSNVRLLSEDQPGDSSKLPTAANIRNGFKWLLSGARAGDLLFFAYSGHGSQWPDDSGKEADGLDECLCPLDCNSRPWPANIILDDELHDVFYKSLPDGVRCVCIYDCCHSGTVADLPVTRGHHEHERSRYLEPPPEVKAKIDGLHSRFKNKLGSVIGDDFAGKLLHAGLHTKLGKLGALASGKTKLGQNPEKLLWVFSGCQDHQTSADAFLDGQQQGAFTWALHKSLSDVSYKIPYEDLLHAVRGHLKRRFKQVPALSTTYRPYCSHHYLANA